VRGKRTSEIEPDTAAYRETLAFRAVVQIFDDKSGDGALVRCCGPEEFEQFGRFGDASESV
jgi:hypothetical protein